MVGATTAMLAMNMSARQLRPDRLTTWGTELPAQSFTALRADVHMGIGAIVDEPACMLGIILRRDIVTPTFVAYDPRVGILDPYALRVYPSEQPESAAFGRWTNVRYQRN